MGLQQDGNKIGKASERVGGFGARCLAAGLADTPQRRLIYQCLAESLDHPTAEAVFLRVKAELPKVSLATVYRNLKLFAEAGLIDEVATGRSLSRYDGNQDRHHHLICKVCGGVADYYDDKFDSLAVAAGAGLAGDIDGGFEVHDARLNVFGICSACRSAKDSAAVNAGASGNAAAAMNATAAGHAAAAVNATAAGNTGVAAADATAAVNTGVAAGDGAQRKTQT